MFSRSLNSDGGKMVAAGIQFSSVVVDGVGESRG